LVFSKINKILDKVIKAYGVTDQEIRMYLEYHEGQFVGTLQERS